MMHNNLMKRYEKELKSNTAYVERIAELNVSLPKEIRTCDISHSKPPKNFHLSVSLKLPDGVLVNKNTKST